MPCARRSLLYPAFWVLQMKVSFFHFLNLFKTSSLSLSLSLSSINLIPGVGIFFICQNKKTRWLPTYLL
ncbi:hypothetical protein V8F06_012607 [Rhypophila decipiens]